MYWIYGYYLFLLHVRFLWLVICVWSNSFHFRTSRKNIALPSIFKMLQSFCLFTFSVLNIVIVCAQDIYYPDNIGGSYPRTDNLVIGNLRRRDVIPLNPFYIPNYRRRYGGDPQTNLNYRRTKDIRDEFIDRRFEVINICNSRSVSTKPCGLACIKGISANLMKSQWHAIDKGKKILAILIN